MVEPSPVPAVIPEDEPAADPAAPVLPREMDLTADEFVEVEQAYEHDEYVCPSPNCGKSIDTRKQIILSKPARYAHRLNDVLKCPYCGIIFSYRTLTVRVLRS